MTTPHDDADRPVEHDPTGVRALLSSLPDPGPMPDDVVARIDAALRDEAAAPRPAQVPLAAGPVDDDPDAVPPAVDETPPEAGPGTDELAPRRRRRSSPRPLLLAGAAAAVVLAGGGIVLGQTGGLDSLFRQEAASTSAGAPADAGPGADARTGAKAQAAPTGAVASAQRAAPLTGVYLSETAYTPARLALQAMRPGDPRLGKPLRPLAGESPGIGPIGTEIGARDCATGLGIARGDRIAVDLGTFDGVPAAVLVHLDPSGRATAYVVGRHCTLAKPDRLYTRVRLP